MADVKNTQAIFAALVESRATKNARSARKVESKPAVTENYGASMFTGRLLKEGLMDKDSLEVENKNLVENDNEDVVEDIIDNIVVVTDPDKSVEDLEDRADEIQDAIEGSSEGEAAFSDEYVGDKVYACPICGESFFAEEDYNEGDMCPICKAEPTDGFLLQGVVSAIEPEVDAEEIEPEQVEPEADVDVDADEGAIESEDEIVNDDEAANESYNRASINEAAEGDKPLNADIKKVKETVLDLLTKKSPELEIDYKGVVDAIKPTDITNAYANEEIDLDNIAKAYYNPSAGTVDIEDAEGGKCTLSTVVKDSVNECGVAKTSLKEECENICVEPECGPAVEVEIEVNLPECDECEQYVPGVTFDEESFNSCLNQFADENYSDCIESLDVEEVVYSPDADVLTVECKAAVKGGSEVPISFKMKEEECNDGEAILSATESTNVFKVESKKPAFEFKVKKVNGAIKCESMRYGYTTTHSRVGKVKVEGFCRNKARGSVR